jgi:hypothetical protein
MIDQEKRDNFLHMARGWMCDGYNIDIRFIVLRKGDEERLHYASIFVNPQPILTDLEYRYHGPGAVIGRTHFSTRSRTEIAEILAVLLAGKLPRSLGDWELGVAESLHLTEYANREQWYFVTRVMVTSNQARAPLSLQEYAAIDDGLRAATPPVDGLGDIGSWLQIPVPSESSMLLPSIDIHVAPPCDLVLAECGVSGDEIRIKIDVHPGYPLEDVDVAIRRAPGPALELRRRLTNDIAWQEPEGGHRYGTVSIPLDGADGGEVLVGAAGRTVRRHWLLHPARGRNARYVLMQTFDSKLESLRRDLLSSRDADRFERSVSSMFFLGGCSPAKVCFGDAPDLVVITPAGRPVLVECTLRIGDLLTKAGKLVHRRGLASDALAASNHPNNVVALLVCPLPLSQVPVASDELRDLGVVLVTREDLESALHQAPFPMDADQLINDAIARLTPTRA